MRVLIIGANGKVGRIIASKMKTQNAFEPIALIRNKEQAAFFENQGIETRIVSIEDSFHRIADTFYDTNAIVFTAGSGAKTGADKTLTVDLDGAVKCMIAAEQKKIKRFVMVSALKTGEREIWEQNQKLKPYLVAKYYADQYLINSHLDYTILRPGRLLNKPGTGKITIMDALEKESVTREDVASVVIESLLNINTFRKIIDFNNGDKDISEVIKQI